MKTFTICCFCSFLIIANDATGQVLTGFFEKFSIHNHPALIKAKPSRFQHCDPDSILFFGFMTQDDSLLGIRRVYHKYGDVSRAIYEYEFVDDTGVLKLGSIDSTVYDQSGRPVLQEMWIYDIDLNVMRLNERIVNDPHNGVINKDYSFVDHVYSALNFIEGEFADFDSSIVYRPDFSGNMQPAHKTIQSYNSEGHPASIIRYIYFEFNMEWLPYSRQEFFYTPSGRIEKVENSSWNGINDFYLTSTSIYTYDSIDSLQTVISTNNQTGVPVEKLEMIYDFSQNATTAHGFAWDEATGEWVEAIRIYGEFDQQPNFKIIEFEFNFFGETFALRYEYNYPGYGSCPRFVDGYSRVDNEWVFGSRIYFYPFLSTSTRELPTLQWSVYPNPAIEGIWIEAPTGSEIQLSTIHGKVIYTGLMRAEKKYLPIHHPSAPVILSIRNDSHTSSRLIMFNN